jgi:ribosome-associated protein
LQPKLITIRTPYITLSDFLKFAGAVSTGGDAKVLVQAGQIRVNGEVSTQRGRKLYPGDTVVTPDASYQVKAGEG